MDLKVAFVKQALDVFGPWAALPWGPDAPLRLFEHWPNKATLWEMTCLLEADWFIIEQKAYFDYTRDLLRDHPERVATMLRHTRGILPERKIDFSAYDVVISLDPILNPPQNSPTLFAYFVNEHWDGVYAPSLRAPLHGYDLFLDHMLTAPLCGGPLPRAVPFPYLRAPGLIPSLWPELREDALWMDWRTLTGLTDSALWSPAAEAAARGLAKGLGLPVRYRAAAGGQSYFFTDPPAFGDAAGYLKDLASCAYYASLGRESGAGQGLIDAASAGCLCFGEADKSYHRQLCHPDCLCGGLDDLGRKLATVRDSADLRREILEWQNARLRAHFADGPLDLLAEAVERKRAAASGPGTPQAVEALFLNGTRVRIDPMSVSIGGAWQDTAPDGTPRIDASDGLGFFHARTLEHDQPFILDIGANTGAFALLPLVNPAVRGLAFEPSPQAFGLLKRNLSLNGLDRADGPGGPGRAMTALPLALSSKPGQTTLKIPASGRESGLASLGQPRRFGQWYEVPVAVDTLDNVAARLKLGRADLVKIDTEGCELFVLQGGERYLRRHHPDILLEWSEANTMQFGYHPTRIRELLGSWGYFQYRASCRDAWFSRQRPRDMARPGPAPGGATPDLASHWRDIRACAGSPDAVAPARVLREVVAAVLDFRPDVLVECGTTDGLALLVLARDPRLRAVIGLAEDFPDMFRQEKLLPFDPLRPLLAAQPVTSLPPSSLWNQGDRVALILNRPGLGGVDAACAALAHLLPGLPPHSMVLTVDGQGVSAQVHDGDADRLLAAVTRACATEQPDRNPLATPDPATPQGRVMTRIAGLYARGQVREALDLLLHLGQQDPEAPGVRYGLGVCALALGQPQDAITLFEAETALPAPDARNADLLARTLEVHAPHRSAPKTRRDGLTLFAMPKPFTGHVAEIQRNAIASWARLTPRPDIILFGDEPGIAEIAAELGLRHVPEVRRNECGTPLVDGLFAAAQELSATTALVYVNSDILLFDDFPAAVTLAQAQLPEFLLMGRRWDFDQTGPLDFSDPDWAGKTRTRVRAQGFPHAETGIDYFVFTPGLWPRIPPFAIGRTAWDNWLVKAPHEMGKAVVDASDAVLAVHQSHDYWHRPGGLVYLNTGLEAVRNKYFCGPVSDTSFTNGATWAISAGGVLARRPPQPATFRAPRHARERMAWLLRQGARLLAQGRLDLAEAKVEEGLGLDADNPKLAQLRAQIAAKKI